MKKSIRFIACLITMFFSVASFANHVSSKKAIYTATAPAPIGVYSQAIQVGSTVYISGQIPIDPKTGVLVQGDFNVQVEQALKNLAEIAIAAGGDLDDIVKLTVYLSDLNNFSLVNDAMINYFHKPYPARAVIEIKALPLHACVEIEAVMQLKQTENDVR